MASVGHDAGVVSSNDTGAFVAAAKTRQWEREKFVRTMAWHAVVESQLAVACESLGNWLRSPWWPSTIIYLFSTTVAA